MSFCKALQRSLFLAIFLCIYALSPARAHEMRPAIADITLSPSTVSVTIKFAAELFLANIDASQIENTDAAPTAAIYDQMRAMPPAELRAAFIARWPDFASQLYGQTGTTALAFDFVDLIPPADIDPKLARISTLVITAPLDGNGLPVRFGWDAALGDMILRQMADPSIDQDSLYTGYLTAGTVSPAITHQGGDGMGLSTLISNYVKIGFIHIIPRGFDHILFVLGLFLYAARWRPLLVQVTIFTLAHSLTLALAARGLVSIPASIVEPLIAASIAYVALENLWRQKLHASRLVVIFAFGLLHGLGFASVLAEIGLPESDFMISLISFNIGVELGQIAVISGAFLLTFFLPLSAGAYRRLITIPASLVIGAIGIWMATERVLGILM